MMRTIIYADHAATARMSRAAVEAMMPYMEDICANPSSPHLLGRRAAEALWQARETVAGELSCRPEEIYFTSGGSEADNQAILSAAYAGAREGKKHIVSTAFEHHAVLHTLKKLEQEGFEIELLPVHESGLVAPEQAADAVRDDTALVTVMYANNEIGTIQPVAEIGAVCREKGVPFHTDAVQAAGHLPIDVEEQNLDLLSLSAHKFGGPKGIGLLYARKEIPLTSLIVGGAQERGKRAGTENIPAIVGMAAAFRESCRRMDQNAGRLIRLRDRLMQGLLNIPHSALNGDAKKRLPGNVNLCFEGIEGESLLLLLEEKGICASSGSACTSGSPDASHVLLAIGRTNETARGSLRLTLGEENTEAEVEYLIDVIPGVIQRLRDISPLWRDKVSGKSPFYL